MLPPLVEELWERFHYCTIQEAKPVVLYEPGRYLHPTRRLQQVPISKEESSVRTFHGQDHVPRAIVQY